MAKRRMISVDIFETDKFLELSPECQIYFMHLHLMADDDGFVGNPRRLLRMYGLQEDALCALVQRGYLIGFESGVVAIRCWPLENRVKRDRYTPTVYAEEFASLITDPVKGYVEQQPSQPVLQPEAPAAAQPVNEKAASESAADSDIIPVQPATEAPAALPTETGEDYAVEAAQLNELAAKYPAVDVGRELAGMRKWLLNHPEKRRDALSTRRLIGYWLNNAQQRAAGVAPPEIHAAAGVSPPAHMSAAEQYDLRASTVMPKLKKKSGPAALRVVRSTA